MINKILCSLIFTLLTLLNTYACINHYHTVDANGDMHNWGEDMIVGFNQNFNYKLIASKLPKKELEFQSNNSPYHLSDYAVLLMKGGRFEESLEIFKDLYSNLPQEYKLAANLGTAYELNGQLDSALFYIKRGVELNPNAHEGSEWIHIRVLETKKMLLEQADYLKHHTVLDLTSEQKKDSAVRVQLELQIRERFPFTPGPDPIMASLVFDLAECYSNTLSIEYAKALYTTAHEYYGLNTELTKSKIDKMIMLREQHKDKEPIDNHDEGMVIKISGVRYTEILDNNNPDGYVINWTDFNIDTDVLLSSVDYNVKNSEDLIEQTTFESKGIVDQNKQRSSWWFIFIGLFPVALFFLILKMKKK